MKPYWPLALLAAALLLGSFPAGIFLGAGFRDGMRTAGYALLLLWSVLKWKNTGK